MKLIRTQQKGLTEIEVEIRYAQMDATVLDLIKHIEKRKYFVHGMDNGRQYKIEISDIYYAESVDKKTFIYTKSAVFRSELRLYQLCEILKGYDFIQVSKSCIINMNILESIRSLINSRLEATLINGEKINVSRTYLIDIKAAFTSKEDK